MIYSSPPPGSLDLFEAFQHHLLQTKGLSQCTVQNYCRSIHRFLDLLGINDNEPSALSAISPLKLQDYCIDLLEQCPRSAGYQTSALRSFFRYLQSRSLLSKDLQNAFLPFRRSPARLNGYLNMAQVGHLLKLKHYQGSFGKRDRAIVLLASKLGMRAGEIARSTLDDIDWKACTIRLRRTKGGRERLLPMPPEVSKGLIAYLCVPLNRQGVREVFLSSKRVRPLHPSSVGSIAKKAFQQAGLNVPRAGTHLLRHSLATQLVQRGTDLKAVADLLGHQQLNTTVIYTKVNLPMLAQMVMPWPEEVA